MLPESGALVECTGLALSPQESTGLRCRIAPSNLNVSAQYDAERQTVTCVAPKVCCGGIASLLMMGFHVLDCVRRMLAMHHTVPPSLSQDTEGKSCCVYDAQGKLLVGIDAVDSSQLPKMVEGSLEESPNPGDEMEKDPLMSLSLVDRLLAVWILLAMVRLHL